MIQINNLSYGYTRSRKVFSDLSLDLEPGSITGLLGRNGEGKSTLFKLLCGQLLRRHGSMALFGLDPNKRSTSFLQQVYFLPEEPKTPALSIARFAEYNGCFYPNYDRALLLELLQNFDLKPELKLNELSQGQRKKALLAFALSLRVPLLLLDEPTNGLDIPSKVAFRRALAQHTSPEQSVIISTHQVRELEQIIDHVLILEGGQILCNESIARLSQSFSITPISEQPDKEPLYSEASILGQVGLFAQAAEENEAEFSLEFFFNALLAECHKVLAALQSTSHHA